MVLDQIMTSRKRKKKQDIPSNLLLTTDIPDMIRIFYDKDINYEQIVNVVLNKLKLTNSSKMDEFQKKAFILIKKKDPDKFLDFVEDYIKIERIYQNINVFQCINCKNNLEETNENLGSIVCPECGCINNLLTPNIYNVDTDRLVNHLEDDINNFAKIIDKFEGKLNTSITSNLLLKLDTYLKNQNFYDKEYIKSLPYTKDGKKKYTSKKIIWDALEAIGVKTYEDTNYIGYIYWNWKLPNLTKYKEQLIEDYKKTQIVWNNIKHKYNRTASLGTQYRLYVHLKALDYECSIHDFKIQYNIESIRLHNTVWKIMCEQTGVKYTHVTI